MARAARDGDAAAGGTPHAASTSGWRGDVAASARSGWCAGSPAGGVRAAEGARVADAGLVPLAACCADLRAAGVAMPSPSCATRAAPDPARKTTAGWTVTVTVAGAAAGCCWSCAALSSRCMQSAEISAAAGTLSGCGSRSMLGASTPLALLPWREWCAAQDMHTGRGNDGGQAASANATCQAVTRAPHASPCSGAVGTPSPGALAAACRPPV